MPGMRGEEVGLAIKEAIKTIALPGDVRKVTVMLNACLIHLLQFVCDVCVSTHPYLQAPKHVYTPTL